ncbi:MAG TPA: DVUA0089 family protein [Terriglobales bacterium]|nr:DVUA0089 family protein [Terriglobales bacterium]
MSHRAWVLLLLFLLYSVVTLNATSIFFSGNLRNDANVISCGSGCTLTSADSDAAWAQFAARVESFTVASTSTMDAISFSFGGGTSGTGAVVSAGGFSPYLSLFDSSGNFLASTYYGTYCPAGAQSFNGLCYDVKLDGGVLGPGTYSIAFSAYLNMSYAENWGSGTLADGFTGLGNFDGVTLDYAFDVNLTPVAIPEPATLALCAVGIAMLWRRRKAW